MKWPPLDYTINYSHLSKALEHYSEYKYVEMPWTASEKAMTSTAPEGIDLTRCQEGFLVGSGEQAFMDYLEELKPFGKLKCCTPCFRNEPETNLLCRKYFMKVELIDFNVDSGLHEMLYDAQDFFGVDFEIIRTDIGYDIVSKKHQIEVGSYGIREWNGFKWVYGTGVAEPRYSQALDFIQNERQDEKERLLNEIKKLGV